jgi:hypothetical protein
MYHGCDDSAFLRFLKPQMHHTRYGSVAPRDERNTSGGGQLLGKGMYVSLSAKYAQSYAAQWGKTGVMLIVFVPSPDKASFVDIPAMHSNASDSRVDDLGHEIDLIVASDDMYQTYPQRCKFTSRMLMTSRDTSNPIVFFPMSMETFKDRAETQTVHHGMEIEVLDELADSMAADQFAVMSKNAMMTKAYTEVITDAMENLEEDASDSADDDSDDSLQAIDDLLEDLIDDAMNGSDNIHQTFLNATTN